MKIELTNKEKILLIKSVEIMMEGLKGAYNETMNPVFNREKTTLSIILSKLNNR